DEGFIPITVWMTSRDHEAYKAMGLTFVLYHTWTQRSYLLGSGMSTLVSTPAFSFPISMGSLTSGEDYVVLVYAWDSILQVTVTYATQTFGIFIPNWGYPLNIAPFYPNERMYVLVSWKRERERRGKLKNEIRVGGVKIGVDKEKGRKRHTSFFFFFFFF
ncbi:hypothetical protein HMI56_003891, partial [Coelomomyces lativittatus]